MKDGIGSQEKPSISKTFVVEDEVSQSIFESSQCPLDNSSQPNSSSSSQPNLSSSLPSSDPQGNDSDESQIRGEKEKGTVAEIQPVKVIYLLSRRDL